MYCNVLSMVLGFVLQYNVLYVPEMYFGKIYLNTRYALVTICLSVFVTVS